MASFSLTDQDMNLYARQMEQIKARIDYAIQFLAEPFTYPRVESGLLQVRQALEALMLSSLITNRVALEEAAAAFRDRKHDQAYKLVRRLNPGFWPQPTYQRRDEAGKVVAMEPVVSGFLQEDQYLRTWGSVSAWLHARSPFSSLPEIGDGVQLGRSSVERLMKLLNHHNVMLLDRDQMLVCMMNESESGSVRVFGFVKGESAS